MTPEHWRQVTDVFHAALARDSSTRASYLDHACAGDRALREEIDAMLAAHRIRGAASLTARPRFASGTMIGAYRVAALIGAGGIGEVDRARDTKLGRDVAIKVLPEGCPRAVSTASLNRFHSALHANADTVPQNQVHQLAAVDQHHPHVGAALNELTIIV